MVGIERGFTGMGAWAQGRRGAPGWCVLGSAPVPWPTRWLVGAMENKRKKAPLTLKTNRKKAKGITVIIWLYYKAFS